MLVAAVGLAGLYHGALLSPGPLGDEQIYAEAMRAVTEGRPLDQVRGWYYPDLLALLGARVPHALVVLRMLNLLGSALVLGFTGRLLHPIAGLLVAAGLTLWTPVEACVLAGNVSGLLTGLLVLAWLSPTVPRVIALSLGFAFKPYGLAVVLGRPPRQALLPLAVCALAVLGASGRGEFHNLEATSNLALVRPLLELGLPVPWWVPSALVLALAAWWGRGRWMRGMVLGWMSLPLVWEHTAMLLLPAIAVCVNRARAEAGSTRALHLLVLLIVLLVFESGHYMGYPDDPLISAALGLLPASCAGYLAWRAVDPS